MKKILLSCLFILGITAFGSAQNFSLEMDTMFLNIDLNTEEEFTVDVFNDFSEDILLTWELSNFDVHGAWGVRICDNKACYDNEDGAIPGVATMNPILTEAFAFIKLRVKPYDSAYYGKIEFFLYEEGDQANGQLLVFIINAGGLSIEENVQEPTSVYPNPVKEDLFITLNNTTINQLQILDAQGRVVRNQNVFGSAQRIDMQGLSKGMYLVQTFHGNNVLLESIPIIKY